MAETKTLIDPFLNKEVTISTRLVDRLRGRYANGPTMANGQPEFGWREFQTPPVQHEAAAEIERLRAALDLCMTGGNHLAGLLIQKLGPDFATKYPPDLDAESALRRLSATPEYDVWCCWAAIMRARALSEASQTTGEAR